MAVLFNRIKNNFTILPNSIFNNGRALSFKAIGLYSYLCSRPDEWNFNISEICNHCTDGRESVTNGLKELESLGYLIRHQQRDNAGRISYNYEILQTPTKTPKPLTISTGTGLAGTGLAGTGLAGTGKPDTIKTDSINTDLSLSLTLSCDNTTPAAPIVQPEENTERERELFENLLFKYPKKSGSLIAFEFFKTMTKEEQRKASSGVEKWLQINSGLKYLPDLVNWLKNARYNDILESEKPLSSFIPTPPEKREEKSKKLIEQFNQKEKEKRESEEQLKAAVLLFESELSEEEQKNRIDTLAATMPAFLSWYFVRNEAAKSYQKEREKNSLKTA